MNYVRTTTNAIDYPIVQELLIVNVFNQRKYQSLQMVVQMIANRYKLFNRKSITWALITRKNEYVLDKNVEKNCDSHCFTLPAEHICVVIVPKNN